MTKAYLNALGEEGTRQDLIEWLHRLDGEVDALRAALLKFVDHFGPLEDNSMVHEDARKCFKLARAALGPKTHDAAIRAALSK